MGDAIPTGNGAVGDRPYARDDPDSAPPENGCPRQSSDISPQADIDVRLKNIGSDLKALQDSIGSLKQELAKTQTDKCTAMSTTETMRVDKDKFERDNIRLRSTLAETETKLQASVDRACPDAQRYIDTNLDLNKRLDESTELEKSLKSTVRDYADKIGRLETEIDCLQSRLNESSECYDSLEIDLMSAQEEIQVSKLALTNLQMEIDEVREERNKTQHTLKEAVARETQLQQELRAVKGDRDQFRARTLKAETSLTGSKIQVQGLEMDKSAWKARRTNLEEHMQALRSQVTEATTSRSRMESKAEEEGARADRAYKKLRQFQDAYRQKE
jgi:chromosome segregation ATPase